MIELGFLAPYPRLDVGWHAVVRMLGTFGRIPEVMRNEFEQQAFRRQPGEG